MPEQRSTFIIDCPWCKAKVAAVQHGRAHKSGQDDEYGEPYAMTLTVGECPNCSALLAGEKHQVMFEGFDGPEDQWTDIVRIFPKEDGTIWVLTDRGENDAPGGASVSFDVFDRTGHFVRRVTANIPYVPGRDELYIYGDFIAVVVNGGAMGGAEIFDSGDADVPEEVEVRCFAVVGVE